MRIDDDSAERAQQEARAQEKKLQQQQQKRRTDEATAFDKALQGRQGEVVRSQVRGEAKQADARSAIAAAIQSQREGPLDEAEELTDPAGQALLQEEGRTEQAERDRTGEARGQQARGQGQALQQKLGGAREQDRAATSHLEQSRGEDGARAAGQSERSQGQLKDGDSKLTGRRLDQKEQARTEERRADARTSPGVTAQTSGKVGGARGEKEQGQGGQGGQKDGQPGAFKLPPAALMAPPPLARPKEAHGDSRLRQIAQEIAEKIVKHVRVGTNKMGLPEFQIELKSDILKGLKVKVSGRHGRIRALFASKDREVLKQLRGEIDSLKEALTSRGFKVDALEIEEERG